MSERMPRTPKEEVAHASMEGNVYLPQNALGIALRSAERCIESENPPEMISALIAPIPEDDALEQRTAKANAQHKLHSIGRELSVDDVRRTLISGNITTLNFIAASLGESSSIGYIGNVRKFTETGEWANEKILSFAELIKEKLTPEKAELLRKILPSVNKAFTSEEVQEKLKRRKELFKGWESMDDQTRHSTDQAVNRLSAEIIEELKNEAFEAGELQESLKGKILAMNVIGKLLEFNRN